MNTANSQPSHNDDEIDLFELVVTLWRSKGVIIAITLLCTILAGLVAFFVIKPTYQAEAMISEPNTYQIEALNKGIILLPEESSNDQAVKKLSTEDFIKPLTQSLNSMGVQRQFFTEKYIPMFSGDEAIENNQQAFQKFRSNLSIKENQSKTGSTLSFTAGTPKVAYDVVTQFLDFADNHASNVILENRKSEINTFITNLESTLSGIRAEIDAKTAYQIREYKNALEIANNLDINSPVIDGNELFQQGTVALEDKIKFLEAERNDYSQNSRFNTITSLVNSYKAISLPEAKEIATFQYTFAPELPEKPTKPNKKLIVVIGFLLGGMLAVMFVLLRQAIRNYQLRSKEAQ